MTGGEAHKTQLKFRSRKPTAVSLTVQLLFLQKKMYQISVLENLILIVTYLPIDKVLFGLVFGFFFFGHPHQQPLRFLTSSQFSHYLRHPRKKFL